MIRVRYAPSPTGRQHVGSIRTALFDYLAARAGGGTFILRIEDTDRERLDPLALQDLYDTFAWLGIHWDEGPDVGGPHAPYVQSERLDTYRAAAEQLVRDGHAYYAYDTPEELEEQRERSKEGYDRRFRDMSDGERDAFRAAGIPGVIRFRVPLDGEVVFTDTVLGKVKRKNRDLIPDPVLLKSDGFPTYHLAAVLDDHLMQITHVLRGQEWLPTATLHILVAGALGFEPPTYCHLPVVTGKDGSKLSKRHGSTAVREFRDQGYLPEAIINYIVRLGWSLDDASEIFDLQTLERVFSLDRLSRSPAVFDFKKLEWMNGHYIREKSETELAELLLPFCQRAGFIADPPSAAERVLLLRLVPLLQPRIKRLADAADQIRFLFTDEVLPDRELLLPRSGDPREASAWLAAAAELIASIGTSDPDALEEAVRARAQESGTGLGDFMHPLRSAITGSTVSPPMFGSLEILGAERALKRIETALSILTSEE